VTQRQVKSPIAETPHEACRSSKDHGHTLLPSCVAVQVWQTEKQDFEDLADSEAHASMIAPAAAPAAAAAGSLPHPHISHVEAAKILWSNALQHFWPRLVATCCAWLANDFA
jgi:hypothetical protein